MIDDDLFYAELRRRVALLRPGTQSRQSKLWQVLREILTPLGLWAIKPRGPGFADPANNPQVKNKDN